MAAAMAKPGPEVVGLDESGGTGIGGRVVDQPQLALDLLGDRAAHLRTAADVGLQADQRVELQVAAGGHQRTDPPQLPALRPGAASVDEQSPLDLRGRQRPQPEQIDPAAARWRRGGGAPAAERLLVGVVDRHRLAGPLLADPTPPRPDTPARTT